MSARTESRPLNRRRFVQTMGATGLTIAGVSALRAASHGNSEAVRMGFIGLGGRGQSLLAGFMERSDCRVTGLCDVQIEKLHDFEQHVQATTGTPPQTYVDLHDLLANSDVDAVVIATPDHWHSPAAIYACQAGKHVYVEKPVSHNVWEGRKLVEAARKYDRVVQVGMQNRSAPYNFKARDYIQSGKLGKIVLVRVYNQKEEGSFAIADDSDPPAGLDWDKWNGPCTHKQFNAARYNHWHNFWCYAGGDVANDGVHQLDLACMVLGLESLPRAATTVGLRRADTAGQTPDTVITTFEFPDFPMTFHQTEETPYMLKTDGGVRSGDMIPYWQQNATRIEIFGTEGVMFLGRHGGGWQVFDRPKNRLPQVKAQEYGRFPDPEHKADFVAAIREGRRPNADVEHGHRSAALCHLANISYRIGNKQLIVDPNAEQITNSEEASALLTRRYRAPYTVPDAV